jgi:hypothetical protein
VDTFQGVQELPSNNMLNTQVTDLPDDPNSATWVSLMGSSSPLHPDFASGTLDGTIVGLPINVIPPGTGQYVTITWTAYGDESDPGPYLLPSTYSPVVEGSTPANPTAGSGDGHLLCFDVAGQKTYELFSASPSGTGWQAASGAIFDLTSNGERPSGWTSACAYGYTLVVPEVKYEEVQSGAINHAIGMTVPDTENAYNWPANHLAGNNSAGCPMGQYWRMKSSTNLSNLGPQAKIIAQAMKTYGMIVTQNGSAWYINGAPNANWDNNDLSTLKTLTGSDLEAIDVSSLMISADSAEAKQSGGPNSTSTTGGSNAPIMGSHHTNSAPRAN